MDQPRRARDLGIVVGSLPPGPLNAITDVRGLTVGHSTLAEQHTGVTAVVPSELPLQAGLYVGNGYGKLVGATQLAELGVLETPVLLTSTLSVFRVADALVGYLLSRDPSLISVNPVVGETNDGYLSDIRSRPIRPEHVLEALTTASAGLPAEGCVGAGAGTMALGFKAGIGTASRAGSWTVGVLVQANFGGVLSVLGVPMPAAELVPPPAADLSGNSCMIVVATDAPLDSRQLGRVARRAVFAMGRVGASFSHGSGDYAIAFSVESGHLSDNELNPLFTATMEAVEEALLNSLLTATTTTGSTGRTAYALPHEALRPRLRF